MLYPTDPTPGSVYSTVKGTLEIIASAFVSHGGDADSGEHDGRDNPINPAVMPTTTIMGSMLLPVVFPPPGGNLLPRKVIAARPNPTASAPMNAVSGSMSCVAAACVAVTSEGVRK